MWEGIGGVVVGIGVGVGVGVWVGVGVGIGEYFYSGFSDLSQIYCTPF